MARKHPEIQIGQRFERLRVVEKLTRSKYRCICDCGNETYSSAQNLRTGRSKSCGCYRRARGLIHGHSRKGALSPEYSAWFRMRQRCNNPNHKDYKHYGGRGIKVCAEWDRPGGFEAFYAEVGPKPPRATLSRIDNNGHYEPGNVRWDPHTFQVNNTRRNHLVEIANFKGTMAQAAQVFGIAYSTLRARIQRGWTDKQALLTPVLRIRKRATSGQYAAEKKDKP
jgi:hypothetical protein